MASLLSDAKEAGRRKITAIMFATLAITPLIYAVAPVAARTLGVLGSIGRHKPYRDDYIYLFLP